MKIIEKWLSSHLKLQPIQFPTGKSVYVLSICDVKSNLIDIDGEHDSKVVIQSFARELATFLSPKKLVSASALRKGDVLVSGGMVTKEPSRGVKTPPGKIDIYINTVMRTWSKDSPISIYSLNYYEAGGK